MVELEFISRSGGGPTGDEPVTQFVIDDDAITSLNATLTNTGVGTFRATIKGDRRLEDRAKVQDRVNINTNDTKFAGYLTQVSQSRSSGDTQLRGKGIAKKLQGGRPDERPITYNNVFAGDAIEDYWSRTPFGNVTVTKQSGDIVVNDSTIQSADNDSEWQSITDIADTTPLYIDGGRLRLAQTAFVREGEVAHVDDETISDVEFSDGLGGVADDITDDFEYSFTNNVTIPKEQFFIAVRSKPASGNQRARYDISLDNNGLIDGDTPIPRQASGVKWAVYTTSGGSLADYTDDILNISSDISPKTHDIRFDPVQGADDPGNAIDLFVVGDGRFYDLTTNPPFDNTVHEDGGYLDGPPLYPDSQTITTDPVTTTRNVNAVNVATTFDDTSNAQRLGVSNNDGDDFVRANNTNSLATTFGTAGRIVITEFRLSKYDNGAQSATPRFNYLGQTIDGFDTSVDLDDRVVFLGVEVSKNHFENLQKLHENSDYVWTIDHDSSDVANMPVFSFPRGEETRSSAVINDNEIDESPEVSGEQFYNVIPLEGGLRDDGTRPFDEKKDQDSINEVGDEISPGLLRDPTISSDVEAGFIAQALLDKALKNGELRGQKTIPPTFAPTPGFAYSVSWLNDADVERTLEEVSVTKSTGSAQTVLDFTGKTGFAQQINELRRNARETSDEV